MSEGDAGNGSKRKPSRVVIVLTVRYAIGNQLIARGAF